MRLLYMMPNYARPSETWTVRMLEYVRDETQLVVAGKPGAATELLGVPVMDCYRLRSGTRLLQRSERLWPWLYRYAAIAAEVRRRRITHVLAHFGHFALYYERLWRRLGLRAFVHFHGMDAIWEMRASDPPHAPLYPPSYPERIRRMSEAAAFIANAHHMAERLISIGVPRDRVTVKHLGVATASAPREHAPRQPVRVVAVGRLQDFKAPEKTIEAFGLAVGAGLDAVLDVVGDGPMRQACEEARARLEEPRRVRLLGARPFAEVDALLADADVFTQHNVTGPVTGQVEAFGVSVLEAMARGVPVVVAASGGVTETVPSPDLGVLFEPGDVRAQADGLLRLGRDPALRQRMAEASWAHVRENFSAERERDQLRSLLESF